MAKRLLDIVGAALLIVLFAPVMLIIALAVRLDSSGPALFRQTRVTKGGRPFVMFKFRSMRATQAAAGPLITVSGDVRVTRVGVLLRKSKLDELPQLFNVLLGNMSLVGPRPEVPKYVSLYPPQLRDMILSVRPGITDEASLEFRNESEILARSTDPERTYVSEILPRKLELYARYARHHSLAGDLRILFRTAWLVLRG
jgi:lipopolysaccharide/colanic/teichoic acid biosynthesis glycosyltransferase